MRLRRETGDFSIKIPYDEGAEIRLPANLGVQDLLGYVIEYLSEDGTSVDQINSIIGVTKGNQGGLELSTGNWCRYIWR